MKSFYILTVLLLSMTTLLAQQPTLEKYSRIQVNLQGRALGELAALSLDCDHGQFERGLSFTGEFSASELQRISRAGFSYQVLIDDLYAHFQSQQQDYHIHGNIQMRSSEGCPTSAYSRQYPTPSNYGPATYGGYFRYEEMLDELDEMHALYPNLISARAPMSETLLTHEGRELWFVRVGDQLATNEGEPQVLYTAVHHAREPNSMSQMIYFLWYLLENYGTDLEATYLVDNVDMYFAPCLNPDGYLYNEATNPNGGGMWRKNRRDNGDGTFGVDLNRNYGYNWGLNDSGSSPNTDSEVYRGPSPFSEPETQMVRDFCNSHEFKVAMNYHTYSNLLLHPWGYTQDNCPDHDQFQALGNTATRQSAYEMGAGSVILYATNGGSDDWMYGDIAEKPAILAYTPEIGPTYYGFWPPAEEIDLLNKATMEINFATAHAVLPYGEFSTDQSTVLETLTGNIPFSLKRTGLAEGALTMSLESLTPNVINVGESQTFNLNTLEEVSGGIAYELDPETDLGEQISLVLKLTNGLYTWTDTLHLLYGPENELVYSNCSSTSAFNNNGWGVDNTDFVSPSASISDSPNGNYQNDIEESITTGMSVSLMGVDHAWLEYRAKWELQGDNDFVQTLAVVNGVGTPLCGRYTSIGSVWQLEGEPLYDGRSTNWVLERMNLDDFIGQSVRIRFTLKTNFGEVKDGFKFDDFRIITVQDSVISSTPLVFTDSPMLLSPNPAGSDVQVAIDAPQDAQSVVLSDALGREVLRREVMKQAAFTLDVSGLPQGTYICRLLDAGGRVISNEKLSIVR